MKKKSSAPAPTTTTLKLEDVKSDPTPDSPSKKRKINGHDSRSNKRNSARSADRTNLNFVGFFMGENDYTANMTREITKYQADHHQKGPKSKYVEKYRQTVPTRNKTLGNIFKKIFFSI